MDSDLFSSRTLDRHVREIIESADEAASANIAIVPWACPIPYFGDPYSSTVATLGINPSLREFMDGKGSELIGQSQRFPTLNSLKLPDWTHADDIAIEKVTAACRDYFVRPTYYKRWFNRLEDLLNKIGASYFPQKSPIVSRCCHLDIVPFATDPIWGEILGPDRAKILASSGEHLHKVIADTKIELIIANGASATLALAAISGCSMTPMKVPSFDLVYSSGKKAKGTGFEGVMRSWKSTNLNRQVRVIGYNHNLQSTHGMKPGTINRIGEWVSQTIQRSCSEA